MDTDCNVGAVEPHLEAVGKKTRNSRLTGTARTAYPTYVIEIGHIMILHVAALGRQQKGRRVLYELRSRILEPVISACGR